MGNNRKHNSAFKLKLIRLYFKGASFNGLSKEFGIAKYLIQKCVGHYQLRGAASLCPNMAVCTFKRTYGPLTHLEELGRENLYLRAENEVLKKLEALAQEEEQEAAQIKKALIVDGLRHKFRVEMLLKILKIPRSSFY